MPSISPPACTSGPLFTPADHNIGHQSAQTRARLLNNLGDIRAFIATHLCDITVTHLDPKRQQESALNAIDHFITRCNLPPTAYHEAALLINQKPLEEFAHALADPAIPHETKVLACRKLTEGLGVCAFGETDNICMATATLTHPGFKGIWQLQRSSLIEQSLKQLVCEEFKNLRHAKDNESMEIHDVQAVKNALPSEWGQTRIEDPHASAAIGSSLGLMAHELLSRCASPEAVARALAEQVADLVTQELGDGVRTGCALQSGAWNSLQKSLTTLTGQDIPAEQLLNFSEDYSQVTLKTLDQLLEVILQAAVTQGLAPAHYTDTPAKYPPVSTFEEAYAAVKHLRQSTSLNEAVKEQSKAKFPAGEIRHSLFASAAMIVAGDPANRKRKADQDRTSDANGTPLKRTHFDITANASEKKSR